MPVEPKKRSAKALQHWQPRVDRKGAAAPPGPGAQEARVPGHGRPRAPPELWAARLGAGASMRARPALEEVRMATRMTPAQKALPGVHPFKLAARLPSGGVTVPCPHLPSISRVPRFIQDARSWRRDRRPWRRDRQSCRRIAREGAGRGSAHAGGGFQE